VLFAVNRTVFLPPPDVGSAVVEIVRRREVGRNVVRAVDLAAAAFNQRRKMLRSSLRGVLEDPGAVLAAAGIAETARPEALEPEAFVRLADIVETL
jgi:16S rRNA (adenine1518-N6/adenine1519-N6)-dimethyltransferase